MKEFYIRESDIEGWGCFCYRDIKAGEVFESDLLPIDRPHNLMNYAFPFGINQSAIALSEFSYCNSSTSPNFYVRTINRTWRRIIFEALVDIPADSEITLHYRD